MLFYDILSQDGTDESIVLRSKELTFYSWMSRNDLCHQKLHLCLDGESRWCEAFGIDSPGVTNRAVQFSVHTATLIIEVRKRSGLQREVSGAHAHDVTAAILVCQDKRILNIFL
jgi:3-methyladenine DNA glycosylase Mpg